MIHSKNLKKGFSFIEILLALAIASMILIPVFIMQGSLLKQTDQYASTLQALLYGESFCNEQAIQALVGQSASVKTQKQIEDPPLSITYTKEPVPSGSSLGDIAGLALIKTQVNWTDLNGKQTQTLVRFAFNQEEESP